MKNNSPARRKITKISTEIEQLEKTIAESKKKLAELKEAKTEAENSEIISIIRNADLSVDDIADMISELTSVKQTAISSVKTVEDNSMNMKGTEIK